MIPTTKLIVNKNTSSYISYFTTKGVNYYIDVMHNIIIALIVMNTAIILILVT